MPTSEPGKARVRRKPAAQYHHGDLRQALLTAARRVLEKDGPQAISLRDLARALDVSHNAPYRHFASRDALLAALAAEGFRELTQRTGAAMAAAAPAARMRARGAAYVRFAVDRPALFRLMFSDALRKSEHAELAQAAGASFETLRNAVASSYNAGQLGERTIAAWALVHGLAHLLIDGQLALQAFGGAPPERIAEIILGAWTDRSGTGKT